MKTLLILLLSCVSLVAAPVPVTILLSWQDTNAIPVLPQYVPGSNDCYILVGTNNITTATPDQWPVLTVFTNWTVGTNNGVWYTNSVQVPPGTWFFSLITSNFWGEAAVPSNVAQTGPASTPTLNLKLSR